MGSMLRIVLCIVMLLEFSSLRSSAETHSPPPSSVDPTPASFTLTIAPGKSTYALYEPVYLTCTLKNPTFTTVLAEVRSLRVVDQYLRLAIRAEGGEPSKYYFGAVADTLGSANRDFAPAGYPGDSLVESVTVFFNNESRDLAFPRTGRFSILGSVYLGNHPDPVFVNANPVSIQVIEPRPVDLQLMDAVGSKDALVSLLKNGARGYCENRSSRECVKTLWRLVNEFPDSAYTPAITLQVASASAEGSTARDTDLEIKVLRHFLQQWPQHAQAPAVLRMLALALNSSGNKSEALDLVKSFEEKYPGRESPRRMIE